MLLGLMCMLVCLCLFKVCCVRQQTTGPCPSWAIRKDDDELYFGGEYEPLLGESRRRSYDESKYKQQTSIGDSDGQPTTIVDALVARQTSADYSCSIHSDIRRER